MGCPIQKSMDQSLFSAPHGLSQSITSFIASYCQGIHQTPFSRLIWSRKRKTCVIREDQKLVRNWSSYSEPKAYFYPPTHLSGQWAMSTAAIRAGGSIITLVSVLDLDNTFVSVAICAADRGNSPLCTGFRRSSAWVLRHTRQEQTVLFVTLRLLSK